MCVEYNGVPIISTAPQQGDAKGWWWGQGGLKTSRPLGPRFGWTDDNDSQNYFAPGPRPASSAQYHGQRGMRS